MLMCAVRHIALAIAFGLLLIVCAYGANAIVKPYYKVDLPDICSRWNEKHVMEASLFLTGVIAYFVIAVFMKIKRRDEEDEVESDDEDEEESNVYAGLRKSGRKSNRHFRNN